MRIPHPALLPVVLLACAEPDPRPQARSIEPADSAAPWVPPGCGDGILDPDEECDEGEDNSDTRPDACRSRCLLPACGDGVADAGEACDDGSPFGGDGCTPGCEIEDGQLESEPDDSPAEARPWEGGLVHGGLPAGDVDCLSLELPSCAALEAQLGGDCTVPARLSLHAADGSVLAVGGPAEDGCAFLDPVRAPGARFLAEGPHALCARPLLDGDEILAYTLLPGIIPVEETDFELSESDDPDGDGYPASCDEDRDGDGVLDVDDNCPDVPNGSAPLELSPSSSGFLRSFLGAGPYTGTSSTDACLPSLDPLLDGVDDAAVIPELGAAAGEFTWNVLWSSSDRIELLTDYGHVEAPREVYLALYLQSPTARMATLALGPDDGVRAWLDGEQVLDIAGCQGTNVDQFQARVALSGGWQRLVLKIRDQGGGWGVYARFLDEAGEPLTDLLLSLSPDGPITSDQADADGDGVGDLCDDTPAG